MRNALPKENLMTSSFSEALRAACQFHSRRQRVIFSVLSAGGVLIAAGLAAGSYPVGFLGALLASGALTLAKP